MRKSCKAFLQIISSLCFSALFRGIYSIEAAELRLDGVDDLAGKLVLLSNPKQSTVFLFLNVDCPISNRYARTLRKLQSDFQKVRWILVYPNADEDSEKIRNSFREYDPSFEASSDTNHTLVKSAQVGVTLEAAVHLPALRFIYRGRIDDRSKVTNGLRQAVD